jgi:hypothetical protein
MKRHTCAIGAVLASGLSVLCAACSSTEPQPDVPDATSDAGATPDASTDQAVKEDVAAPDGGGTDTTPTKHITGIRLVGSPTLVFDHLKDKQQPLNLPDGQVTAWKDKDGSINLTIPHYEEYRMRGPTFASLRIDPAEIFSSTKQAEEIAEDHYDYHHWFMGPYTFDGERVYSLVHSEWYACLLKGDCASGGNQLNSWVTTITSFVSSDRGATWAPNGVNAAHVVARLGYTWTGTAALASEAYQRVLDHSGLMLPSRIVSEAGYFYSIGVLVHRDFAHLDDAGAATVDKYGYVLIRTNDVTNPAGWQGWSGGSTFTDLATDQYKAFLPAKNASPYNASQPQIVHDVQAGVYVLVFALYGGAGPLYYVTTPSLASPVWSDAVEISGSATFATDPRSTAVPCNTGFRDSNYVSVIDEQSPGLNFEFTQGSPWLFYVVNPATCGGDNLARDLYRAQLVIDYQ